MMMQQAGRVSGYMSLIRFLQLYPCLLFGRRTLTPRLMGPYRVPEGAGDQGESHDLHVIKQVNLHSMYV